MNSTSIFLVSLYLLFSYKPNVRLCHQKIMLLNMLNKMSQWMFGVHLSLVIFEMLRFDLGGIRRVVVGSGKLIISYQKLCEEDPELGQRAVGLGILTPVNWVYHCLLQACFANTMRYRQLLGFR